MRILITQMQLRNLRIHIQYVLDCCILHYLSRMLQLDNREIEKETCWIVSNIIAGTVEQVCLVHSIYLQIQAVIDSDCIQRIIALIHSSKADEVKSEAYWVFMNGSTCGDDQQVDFFVKQGVIPILLSMIQCDLQNADVYDALESIIVKQSSSSHVQRVGDHEAEVTGELNPYIAQMDIAFLHETSITMQSQVQKRALAFFQKYFKQCGICHSFYQFGLWKVFTCSSKDNRLKYCNECNCFVCSQCDCSVFHLEYQLAHWEDVELGQSFKCRMYQKRQRERKRERRKRKQINHSQLRKK